MQPPSKPGNSHSSYDHDQTIAARVQQLEAAGLRCLPVRIDAPKQLAYADKPGRRYTADQFRGNRIGIRTGKRADDTYFCRIDIDQHGEHQDAEASFARLLPFIESAPEQFAVRRSTNGRGYDVLFLSPRELPNNQPFTIDSNWIHGAPEQLVPLGDDQLERLLTVVKLRGVNANAEVTWSARAREGLPLIRGYEGVEISRHLNADGMPKSFEGEEKKHRIAKQNWKKLKTATKGQRSEAFSQLVVSLMLLAPKSYGTSIEEKCTTVAAIAMPHNPRRADKGPEHVEKDTAALIARILHGDPYKSRDGHFPRPYWADSYEVARRSQGRPKGNLQRALGRIRCLLREHIEGDTVEHIRGRKLTVQLLAAKFNVEKRTIQRYLAALETQGEIRRQAVPGRDGRLVIEILPGFSAVAKRNPRSRRSTPTGPDSPEAVDYRAKGVTEIAEQDPDNELEPEGCVTVEGHSEPQLLWPEDEAPVEGMHSVTIDAPPASAPVSPGVEVAVVVAQGPVGASLHRGADPHDEYWDAIHINRIEQALELGQYQNALNEASFIAEPPLQMAQRRYVEYLWRLSLEEEDERLAA